MPSFFEFIASPFVSFSYPKESASLFILAIFISGTVRKLPFPFTFFLPSAFSEFILSIASSELYKLWLLSVSFTPLLFSSLFQPQRQLPKSISFNIYQLIHFSNLLLSQLFCSFLIEISLLDFLPQFFYLLILIYYFVCKSIAEECKQTK